MEKGQSLPPASMQDSSTLSETAACTQQNQEEKDPNVATHSEEKKLEEEKKFEFIGRVANIPFVNSACNIFTGVYGQVKGSNEYIKKGLETGEAAVKYAAEQAGTMVSALETPLHTLDSAACKGLAVVEQNVPIIKKPAGEIVDTSKGYLDSARTYTVEKVAGVCTFTTEKVVGVKTALSSTADAVLANPYTQQVFGGLNVAMDKAEHVMQSFFPMSDEESSDECMDSGSSQRSVITTGPKASGLNNQEQVTLSVKKVKGLSTKVRARIQVLALQQLQQLQQQSTEWIQYISGTVEWVQLAKGNIDSATLKSRAQLLLAEINKTDKSETVNTGTEGNQREAASLSNTEKRVIQTGRFISGQLVKAYKVAHVALQLLPDQLQQMTAQAINYTSDIYTHFSQATGVKDISDTSLTQCQNHLLYLQATIGCLHDNVIKEKALGWLVPDATDSTTSISPQDSKGSLEELVIEAGVTVTGEEFQVKTEQSAKN